MKKVGLLFFQTIMAIVAFAIPVAVTIDLARMSRPPPHIDKFEVGDRVRIKGESRELIVDTLGHRQASQCVCMYYDIFGKVQWIVLSQDTLEKILE